MTRQRVSFPSFRAEEPIKPYDMRQLVAALEYRFQSLEDQGSVIPNTDVEDDGSGYAPVDHTHIEAEITDLGDYLTDLSNESIFDLSDVTGTPDVSDTLAWNGSAFVPVPAGAGALALNDLTNVTVPAPNDGEALVWDDGAGQWVNSAIVGVTTLADLLDTDVSGQTQFDMLYNANGTDWHDTAGELKWEPTVGMTLANSLGIRWENTAFAPVETLVFKSEGSIVSSNLMVSLSFEDGTEGGTTTTNAGVAGDPVFDANGSIKAIAAASGSFGAHIVGGGTSTPPMKIISALPDPFDLSANDYTIAFDYQSLENSGDAYLLEAFGTPNHQWRFQWIGFSIHFENNAGTNLLSATTLQNSTWYHVAVTKQGDTMRMFIDGVLVDTFDASSESWAAGAKELHAGRFHTEYLDNILLIKNQALWTENFTPPTDLTSLGFTEKFIVGDPAYDTIIEGLSTNITSAATDIDGTLNVDGDSTLVGALSVGGISSLANDLGIVTVLDDATGDEVALQLDYTTNKATSGADTGFQMSMTDTLSPGTSLFADYRLGAVSLFDWGIDGTYRIYDATGADSVAFSHDGTGFNTAFTGTTEWTISGAARVHLIGGMDLWVRDGGFIRISDPSDAKYSNESILTDTRITSNLGLAGWNINSLPYMQLSDGGIFRITDSTNNDNAEFSHDGTDFLTDFTNTTEWRILKGTPVKFFDGTDTDYFGILHDGTDVNFLTAGTGEIKFLGGITAAIYDSTGIDAGKFSHDGTDFNTAFTNTTDWSITGQTGAVVIGPDETQPWLTLDAISTGDGWDDQGAGLTIGESGTKGAGFHVTYNGATGGIWVGSGTVDDTTTTGGGLSQARLGFSTVNDLIRAYGGFELRYGPTTGYWRFYGPAGTAYVEANHDNSTLSFTGTSTTDFDVLGLTGEMFVDADLRTSGDLTVGGTTTTINSNIVSIADNIIVLNSDATDPPTENAGIQIYRGGVVGDVEFQWNETNDAWEFVNAASETIGDFRGSGTTRQLLLPQIDNLSAPTLAFGDGDTGFYESADDVLRISIGNSQRFFFSSNVFGSQNTAGAGLVNEAASATNPTFTPNRGDSDTGVGWAAADQLSLITGGVEQVRLDVTGNHIINSLLDEATGDEIALSLDYTVNKLTSGDDTGLLINKTDTLSQGTSRILDVQVGGVTQFNVQDDGVTNLGNFSFNTDQVVGAGQDNYVLTYDDTGGQISLEPAAGGSQTPWTSDIDGAGFGLDNIDRLEIQASGVATDTATFTHDGTDFVTTFANTTDWDINTLGGNLRINSGGLIIINGGFQRIYSAVGGDFMEMSHDGTDFNLDFTGTTDLNINDGTVLKLWNTANSFHTAITTNGVICDIDPSGSEVRLVSAFCTSSYIGANAASFNSFNGTTTTDSKYVLFAHNAALDTQRHGIRTQHDGLALGGNSFDFVLHDHNNADSALPSLFNFRIGDDSVDVRNGIDFKVLDSTNADDVTFSHDGTDFSIAGTNTTAVNFSGFDFFGVPADVGLTADVGSAQGNGVITSSYNVYSTVATTGDAATLPATFPVGRKVYVKNDGANSMDVFPASGDDAGAGTNTAVAVAAGDFAVFIGTVADTTWTKLMGGTA